MRVVHLLIIFSVLSFSMIMHFGHAAFATIQVPNMTETEPPSGFTPAPDLYPEPILLEKLAMSAIFVPGGPPLPTGNYRMTAFGLNLTPNSQLCPENNCQFGFEDGQLYPNTITGGYVLTGRLKVATQQATGMSSEIYQVRGELNIFETFEEPGKLTYFLTDGELKIGRGIVITRGDFDYRITNGSLVFTPGQASLVIIGERYPTLNAQSQATNLTALAQPVSTTVQQQQQQQQQPANTTTLQQQQPTIGQTPLSQLQQLTATSPQYGIQQPTAQTPATLQPLPTQSLMQSTPQTQLQNIPAQPYGLPSTSATIQPQLSALPPTATTFPPSVLPPVNSLQSYGTTGGLGYPSTLAGQYGLGAAGTEAGTAITSVSTSSQLISPWFPSLPASYCGGTFLLTIEGTPSGNGDNDNKIEAADNNDKDDGDDDDNGDNSESDREKRLLSLQVNSDNTRIFTDDDAISGEIFLGKNNIEKNKGNDFDIKSIFNDCQVVTYSKT